MNKRYNSLLFLLLLALAGIFLLPIVVTVVNSFMSPFEITNRYTSTVTAANGFGVTGDLHCVEISLIPDMVSLKQYIQLFFDSPLYLQLFWNSVQLTLPVVIGQLLISVSGASAFAMRRFRYQECLFFLYIVVMLMPLQVVLVPNYIVAEFFGITGSYLAMILPGIFNPFGMFLIRQYLKGLPKEYIEAAQIDGAGHGQILLHIIRPMIQPAMAALVILTFIEYWNLVDQAVVFIGEAEREPLSAYLSRYTDGSLELAFAASTFYMLPALLIFLHGQEEMVEGIQLSGIK